MVGYTIGEEVANTTKSHPTHTQHQFCEQLVRCKTLSALCFFALPQLPVLSTGEGVGCRVCLCDGVSSMSGRWRVEECGGKGGEGERVRRLVFMNTSHLVQTEMRLRPGICR